MERVIRHELSKIELIFDDCVDVPPGHCLTCVERGISRRNVQECEEWRALRMNSSKPGLDWSPIAIEASTFVVVEPGNK